MKRGAETRQKSSKTSGKMAAARQQQQQQGERGTDARLQLQQAEDTDPSSSPDSQRLYPSALRDENTTDSLLLTQIRQIIREEISQASKKLYAELSKEIRELGSRTSSLEDRMDNATTVLEGHEQEIEDIRAELAILHDKQEDMENRSRRSNLRIRGLPESITDLTGTVTALFQELAPAIPPDRLDLDRVHRALSRRTPNGPPRDIIVKCHHYLTKETLLKAAATQNNLSFQGHRYQIYADLAPSTILKRRAMKPYLQILRDREVKYRWGFPFKLLFTIDGRQFQMTTPDSMKKCLRDLGLPIPSIPTSDDITDAHDIPRRRTTGPKTDAISSPPRSTPPPRGSQTSQALQKLLSQRFTQAPDG